MQALFLRITAVLFITFLCGLVVLIYVGVTSYNEQLAVRHGEDAQRAHIALTLELKQHHEAQWQTLIERIEVISAIEIDIVDGPLNSPSPSSDVQHLSTTLQDDTLSVMYSINEQSDRWLKYTRTYPIKWALEDALALLLMFVAVPIAMFFVLRPIAKKINELGRVTQAYAAGDLSQRSLLAAPMPLEQLADDIHNMAGSLSQKIVEQQVMTNAISHELKTPLTRMRMANDLALRENSADASRRHLEEIDEELTVLEQVIGDTSTLAQLTMQDRTFELEPIELRAVPTNATVLGNRPSLQRIFVNLLINAERYAKQQIEIGLATDQEHHTIIVTDDGPGIPPSEVETVLAPFGRADRGRSRATGGSGMGLAIALKRGTSSTH